MTHDANPDWPQVTTGILGGTGLYEINGLEILKEIQLETPFGKPSDSYVVGNLEDIPVAFLSRHGRGHLILPHELNYRANIYGFKMLGIERIISVSAVGSLKEELMPKDIVIPDQFFDRTHRKNTFFGDGVAVHIGFDLPVCPVLAQLLFQAGQSLNLRIHKGGTYICIEGPAFSSKAESNIYRGWGFDVIGMTSVTEAKLSREAEICYSTMSLVTDYDVWHESEGPVSTEIILDNLAKNIENAKRLVKMTVLSLSTHLGGDCPCQNAVANSIVTRKSLIPESTKENLKYILGKYL